VPCQWLPPLTWTHGWNWCPPVGVSSRTVGNWAASPEMTPRPAAQDALDKLLAGASTATKARFEQFSAEEPVAPVGSAQALRVAIAIVLRDDQVLLVRRRNEAADLTWQFPAGIVKPREDPENVAVRETLAETGIHCSVAEHVGGRLHPVTGVLCDYFWCHYLVGEAANQDNVENAAVIWAARRDVARFIERDAIYPPVLMILEGQRDTPVR
jgi:8-oxo-dGTP diphosphatase